MADPIDLRDVPPEQYWEYFEKQRSTLMSYRYMGRQTPVETGHERDTMALRHDMRNAHGGILVAPLCLATPEGGGMADTDLVTNPVIASMQILDDCRGVTKVAFSTETVRMGRTMGFSRSTIVDAADESRVLALSEGMGVSIGETPGGYEEHDDPPIMIEDSPSLPALHQVFGASQVDEGIWELPILQAEHASYDAALHLGPQHVVLEAAATELAAAAAGGGVQIQGWHVMFTSRGKVGPFRTDGEAFPGGDGIVGCRLLLRDVGNGDRVVSSATATFRSLA